MKTDSKILPAANIVAFLGVLVVNALASTVGINGRLTGAVSDGIPNLFVPAGLTFSIWGVIYLALLLFTVYQARGLFRTVHPAPGGAAKIGWLFVLSSAANVGWLFLWHFDLIGLSMIAMLILLCSLLAIYVRLGTGLTRASAAERWLLRVPFSLYLGWITVATIANASAFLVNIRWNGFGLAPEVWTVAVIVVAALVTLVVLLTRRDAAYGLVVLWALAGIALKRSGDASSASQVVFVTAIACGAVVAAAIIASAVRSAVRPLSG